MRKERPSVIDGVDTDMYVLSDPKIYRQNKNNVNLAGLGLLFLEDVGGL